MIYENIVDNFFIVSNSDYSFSYPLHVHQYIELVRVMEGTLRMQIGPSVYVMSKGDLAIIFPNVVHDYQTLSDDSHSNLAISNCVLPLMPLYKRTLEQNYPLMPVIRADHVPDIVCTLESQLHEVTGNLRTSTTEEIRDERTRSNEKTGKDRDIDRALVGSLFSSILGYCIPLIRLTPADDSMNRELSVRIISYVGKHALENLKQEDVTKKFGVSKFALSRIFSNILKTSFRDYINSQRCVYAAFRLMDTEEDIIHICYSCGFQSQQTFNRVFRQHYGVTPSQFRVSHAGMSYPENQKVLLPEPLLPEAIRNDF